MYGLSLLVFAYETLSPVVVTFPPGAVNANAVTERATTSTAIIENAVILNIDFFIRLLPFYISVNCFTN